MNLIFNWSLRRALSVVVGISVALLGASRARAEDDAKPSAASAPDEAAGEDAVEVVVTGTRAVENRSRAVVRVDVVTRAEARRRGATNVGEAVSGELGAEVNPSAYGALGRPSAAQMGGLDRDRVLVLEDGERVVGDFGGAIDLSKTSLSGVSRVELISGPTSALYGSSAMGGVINVISAPPEREGGRGACLARGGTAGEARASASSPTARAACGQRPRRRSMARRASPSSRPTPRCPTSIASTWACAPERRSAATTSACASATAARQRWASMPRRCRASGRSWSTCPSGPIGCRSACASASSSARGTTCR
jgi:hypothetical protein